MKPDTQLQLFHLATQRLIGTRYLKTPRKISFKIDYLNNMPGNKTNASFPDNDDFNSFLVLVRPFIAPNEDIMLDKVYNTCIKHIHNDKMLAYLHHSKHLWTHKKNDIGVKFEKGNKNYTPEYIWKMIANGGIFHYDPEKVEEVDTLLQPDYNMVYLMLIMYTDKIVKHIINLDKLIMHARELNCFDWN